MTPRDWFALGVRLFGVWMLIRAAAYIASFVDLKLGLTPIPFSGGGNPTGYLLYATFDLALAALFLLWTRKLVNWTYGEDPANKAVAPGDSE
jgi:hypothetical protein